jgi:exosortase A-associated hydrolase 2
MNKSRRMAALAARAFAQDGWCVLQPDLFGCGDSYGDFGDATWSRWTEDVGHAYAWLRDACEGPVVLWTLRAGALVASDWLAAPGAPAVPLLLWQPVVSGRQHLSQFLRLKAIADMIADADARASTAAAREALAAGKPVEVAGYVVSPQLASGLERAALGLPRQHAAPVALLEVALEPSAPSPAVVALAQKWSNGPLQCTVSTVAGPAFWQSQEIETAPALLDRSREWLRSVRT